MRLLDSRGQSIHYYIKRYDGEKDVISWLACGVSRGKRESVVAANGYQPDMYIHSRADSLNASAYERVRFMTVRQVGKYGSSRY